MRVTLSIILLILGMNALAGDKTTPVEEDLGRLQGSWTALAGTHRDIRVVLEVKGRSVTVAITTPQGLDFQVEGELKLDQKTSPRSLDLVQLHRPRAAAASGSRRRLQGRRRHLHRVQWRVPWRTSQGVQARRQCPGRYGRLPPRLPRQFTTSLDVSAPGSLLADFASSGESHDITCCES